MRWILPVTQMWILISAGAFFAEELQQDEVYRQLEDQFSQIMIEQLDFINADLKDVMRLLATRYRLNIFVADDVERKLTIHLVNIPLSDAIRFIIEDHDLVVSRKGPVYILRNTPPPAPEPPPPKVWDIHYQDGLLSLDFQEEEVRDALGQISKLTGLTILLDREVRGTISGTVYKVPVDDALFSLLKNNGFYLQKNENLYQVRRWNAPDDPGSSSGTGPVFWLAVNDQRIDLEATNIPLSRILHELSQEMGINLFLLGDITGTVNSHVRGLTLEQCLSLILGANNYAYRLENGIYLIGDRDNKMLITSRLVKLSHMKVESILEMLPQRITEKAEILLVREHNAILLTGPGDLILDIRDIVRNLDRPVPQILIEALVIDYNYQNTREISVQAGLSGSQPDSTRGTADLWFPNIDLYLTGDNVNRYLTQLGSYFGIANIGKLPEDFYLKIKALESAGKANIRSKPQIATLNGHTADITIGQTQYYILKTQTPIRDPSQIYLQESQQFQTIEANITLKITPWVSASGEITVEIHPEFNNPVGQFSPEIPPTIQRRALNSTVRLQDGETIILGGLIQTAESDNISQIPVLGSLPLLGRLFQNKKSITTKSELIIYITPHLYGGDEFYIEG